METRAALLAALLAAGAALVACSDDGGAPSDPSNAGSAGAASASCSGEFDEYAPGMSKPASPGSLTLRLEDANPAPPGFGTNVWTLLVLDENEDPVTGALVHATPYMPAHTHGSAEVVVEEQGDGEYHLEPVVLNMPGVWEIAIDVTPPGGESSEALFTFCVPEL